MSFNPQQNKASNYQSPVEVIQNFQNSPTRIFQTVHGISLTIEFISLREIHHHFKLHNMKTYNPQQWTGIYFPHSNSRTAELAHKRIHRTHIS